MADNSAVEICGDNTPPDLVTGSSDNSLKHADNSVGNHDPSQFIEKEQTSGAKPGDSVDVKMDKGAQLEVGDESAAKEREEDEWLDILGSGHLKKKVIVKGETDSRPHRGDTVLIDIVGKLEDDTEFERAVQMEVVIGDAEVVQGIEYALPLMELGEVAEIIVSPRFGYGSLGRSPDVPKDATLYYTVTLAVVLGIKDIPSLSVEERLHCGRLKKDRGNWWYQRKEYHLAIQCYRKALQYFEEEIPKTDLRFEEAKVKTYNNLSAAHYYLDAYDSALNSVNVTLSLDPCNIKGIYRKVKILKSQGELEQAITLAKNGLKINPYSPALQDELGSLLEMKRRVTSAQKALYQKMFRNTEDRCTNESSSERSILRSLTWVGVITIAVGILGIVAVKFKQQQ